MIRSMQINDLNTLNYFRKHIIPSSKEKNNRKKNNRKLNKGKLGEIF
jgi:hypothetical protein